MADSLKTLKLLDIKPAPDNLRGDVGDVTDLAASIAAVGLIEPIRVAKNDDGEWQVVAGHRRYEALCLLANEGAIGDEVKVIADSKKLDGATRDAMMIVENMQRHDLAPSEEAEGVRRLIQEHQFSVKDAASTLGVSRKWVEDRLAMLNVPEYVFDTPKHKNTDQVLGVKHLAMLGNLPDDVRERLTKDGKVPSEYEIEDRQAKVRSQENAAKLLAKLQKDGILATTEKALKKLVGLTDLTELDGNDLVIASRFTQAEAVEELHSWQSVKKPTVKLDQILRVKLDGYAWDTNVVYVTKNKGGFAEWYTAELVFPKVEQEEEDEHDRIDEENRRRAEQYKIDCHHAFATWVQTEKAAQITKALFEHILADVRDVAKVNGYLGIEVVEPKTDDLDPDEMRGWGTKARETYDQRKTEAYEENVEILNEYIGKSGTNLARAAVAATAAHSFRFRTDWPVEWPEEPEMLDYPATEVGEEEMEGAVREPF